MSKIQPPLKIFTFAPMGAGKDTVADILVEEFNFGSIALGGLVRKYINENNPKYIPKSNRGYEIEVAEKIKSWFGQDYWARKSQPYVDQCTSNGDSILIRDGRFYAEYDYYVKEQGFIPVKIIASEETRKARIIKRSGGLWFDEEKFKSRRDCEIIDEPGFELFNNTDSLDLLKLEIRKVLGILQS